MRRFARWSVGTLAVLGLGALAASVGYVPAREFRVAGPGGRPVAAVVAFVYAGSRTNFVDSLSWRRRGAVILSPPDGRVRLPGLLYLKRPWDGWLAHRARLIHAPALHAAARVATPADGSVLAVADHAGDPEAWDRAFGALYSLLAHDMAFGESDRYAVAPETTAALARLVVGDHRAFLAAHGGAPRTIPADPPAHLRFAPTAARDAWRDRLRRQIAREPTWGVFTARRYGKKIRALEERFDR